MGNGGSEAARPGGAWGSTLRVPDFAAIRSVGFEPVGQVYGAAVYYLGTVLGAGCPGTSTDYLLRDSPSLPGGGTGPGPDPIYGAADPAAKVAQGLYAGRRAAIERMTEQCAELGGHGIVGATVRVREIPPDPLTAGALEFTVIGTAVRAGGCPPLRRPFAADLSGPDFAKLIMTGWAPVGLALGISVSGLHDDSVPPSSGPLPTENAELAAYTALVAKARQGARHHLEQEVRGVGADGVVVSAATVRVRFDPCHAHPGGTDYFAEAIITGTAVTRFGRPPEATPPRLSVLRLDEDRSNWASSAPVGRARTLGDDPPGPLRHVDIAGVR
jgi:uncharacterized protein YbjQ (UPF0145 family)